MAHHSGGDALLDVTPPAAVGGLTLAGISLPDVVLVLTAVYTLLRIGGWSYDRLYKPWRVRNGRK